MFTTRLAGGIRMDVFDGLSGKLPGFLRKLGRNNSREWFHVHQEEYRRHVAAPLASLAEALVPGMLAIDDLMVKKLSRPQRDIRFSKDKSPYRTAAWFSFRRPRSEWTGYPAFFFEAAPECCRWGMGFYSARPATMSALRGIARDDPARCLAAMAAAAGRGFALLGDLYKKHPPIPDGASGEIADLIRHRNVYLCRVAGYGPPVSSEALVEALAADYAALGAMYRLFCEASFALEGSEA
jgi:uncharacterized protein (TIGR02453 family)